MVLIGMKLPLKHALTQKYFSFSRASSALPQIDRVVNPPLLLLSCPVSPLTNLSLGPWHTPQVEKVTWKDKIITQTHFMKVSSSWQYSV